MIQVWIGLATMFMFSAYASEFTHIKLSPAFEQYITQPRLKSVQSAKSLNAPAQNSPDEFTEKMKVFLLGTNGGAGDFNTPFPTDGEESPLFEVIRGHLENAHREIGAREVTQLDFLNRQFNLGTENLSGFSWQKPYGVVHVWADRQVVPNLFGNNWLVQDTFTFDIEATTFLERANEAGITSMTPTEIGAFAGITFKRIYTYYHYANSYTEGLSADFSKLFLPFVKMNPNSIGNMNNEEIIKREDNWTVAAGGIITSPPYYGFSASAGILAQFAYQQAVSVQSRNVVGEHDEKYRMKVQGKKTASAGVSLSLQLEFFKILKFTIMNYDLTYEYSAAKEFTLGMSPADWTQVNNDAGTKSELRRILAGVGQVRSLERYVVALEEDEAQALQQRGSLLLWGRLQKSNTEQIRVIKDNTVRVFYKSYAQNMRVVQNFLSRLFSAVIYKLFKFPIGVSNAAMYNRQVNLEYEATHPQAGDPKIARIDKTEQFSFVLNQSYEASRTDRWLDKKFKNDLIWFVDAFTTLPKDYKTIIRSGQLKGPMLIESKFRVEKAGFEYVINLPDNTAFGYIAQVCKSKKAKHWVNEARRQKLLSKILGGKEACVKNIGKDFLAFKADYQANALKPSLAKFKSFLTGYYKEAQSLAQLTNLFGAENVFINGQLKAATPVGAQFVTSFSTGQFRGLGVIDNFKRASGSRQPASIVSE